MLVFFVDFETMYMNWTKGKDREWRDYWLEEVCMSCPVGRLPCSCWVAVTEKVADRSSLRMYDDGGGF